MVPEKYSLAAIAQHLLALFEVRRPGIRSWDVDAQERFRREAESALQQMEQQCRELGVDDPPHWQRARAVVRDALLPRYAQLAEAENEAAARDYGMWRGGDLVARGAFALCGLVLGAIALAVPWIPVQEKWVPWALFVLGPFLPDAYSWWYRRRYRRRLDALVLDLAREGATLDAYRPLSEVQQSLGFRDAAPPVATGGAGFGGDGRRPQAAASNDAPVPAPRVQTKG